MSLPGCGWIHRQTLGNHSRTRQAFAVISHQLGPVPFAGRLRGLPRVRVMLLGLLAPLLVIGIWIGSDLAPRTPVPSTAPNDVVAARLGPRAPAADERAPVVALDAGSVPPPAPSPTGSPPDPEAIRAAVDALVDGRPDTARRRYAALAATHPECAALALAVEILTPHPGGDR